MGPPPAESVAAAAACSDEHSLYILVHFADRDDHTPQQRQRHRLVAGDPVEVFGDGGSGGGTNNVWRTAIVVGAHGESESQYRVHFSGGSGGGGGNSSTTAADVVVDRERIYRQNYTLYVRRLLLFE